MEESGRDTGDQEKEISSVGWTTPGKATMAPGGPGEAMAAWNSYLGTEGKNTWAFSSSIFPGTPQSQKTTSEAE